MLFTCPYRVPYKHDNAIYNLKKQDTHFSFLKKKQAKEKLMAPSLIKAMNGTKDRPGV